ncbi:LysR substrate-binding domain-containing protein, partial [Escherichia coli]|uniref:LysR substrate-binding domain-containing protein n=1 Tax=Escherichia coli TaxID=562 RepID=UPI003CE58BD6
MPLEGVVRLGFNPGIVPSLLFPLMSELRRTHPRLEVRCQTAPSEQLVARLQSGNL